MTTATRLGASMLAIHLVAFLFGMTGILGSLIEADPNTITFGRAAFAVVSLTPLLFLSTFKSTPSSINKQNVQHDVIEYITKVQAKPHVFVYTALSGVLLAVHWVTFFMSIKAAGVAFATLGFSSFAAFITCFEWFITGGKVSRPEWLRTLGVTTGLILMTPSLDFADQNMIGFLLGLASGFSFAAMAVVNSRKLSTHHPITVARNQNLIVALLLLPFAWPHLLVINAASWIWLALLGILCTGLSHSLFVYSLKRLKVSMAGLVVALEPVYAIIAAWFLFAEVPQLRTLFGGAIIVGSILGVRAATASKEAHSNIRSTRRS